MKPTIIIITTIAALALAGCRKSGPAASTGAPPAASEAALEAVLLAEAPAGASSISEARSNPAPGTGIVISGKIMGRAHPFVDD